MYVPDSYWRIRFFVSSRSSSPPPPTFPDDVSSNGDALSAAGRRDQVEAPARPMPKAAIEIVSRERSNERREGGRTDRPRDVLQAGSRGEDLANENDHATGN